MKGDHRAPFRAKWQFLRGHPGFRHSPVLALFRLAFWRVRCALARPAVVILPRWGLRMYLPAEWRGFAKLMFAFREMYEPELFYLERLLSPGMTFVDVGACYGAFALVAAKLVGSNGRVFAFEPARRSLAILQENISLNGLGNIRLFRMALSDRSGSGPLYHYPDPSRNSLGEQSETLGSSEEVDLGRLDMVLQGSDSAQPDIMKLDVEGAEELVLRGARHTLSATHPAIIFEVNPKAATALGLSPRGAWDFLERMGYSFYCVGYGGHLTPLHSPPEGGNVVALHPGGCK